MRSAVLVCLALAVSAGPVAAQERTGAQRQETTGAQRTEISSAVFSGGMLLVPSADPAADVSRSYVISGAVTRNINRWIGIEGDVGVALSSQQAVSVYGGGAPDGDTPTVVLASGSLVYNITRSDRSVVPYVTAGLGVLHVAGDDELPTYAFAPKTTYLTGVGGGGVRWFPIQHWGVRADYQFLAIRNGAEPAATLRVIRSAHRIYGALVVTF